MCEPLWAYGLILCFLPAAKRTKEPQPVVPEGREGVETVELNRGINTCYRKIPKLLVILLSL